MKWKMKAGDARYLYSMRRRPECMEENWRVVTEEGERAQWAERERGRESEDGQVEAGNRSTKRTCPRRTPNIHCEPGKCCLWIEMGHFIGSLFRVFIDKSSVCFADTLR
jgi:hypothetical protein